MMIKIIKKYLEEIKKQKEIKILLACETGSRAWGFPSIDSDYDIRLIYKHRTEWYLSLSEEKDSIEMMFEDNNLDISGWDLRKTLRLLWKSNPPLLERIHSPIIYDFDKKFLPGINKLAETCYSRIATIHHYLNMAKKCLEKITNTEAYKLKTLFYALRAATACRWILEKTEIPPVQFPLMIKELDISTDLKNRIYLLIKLKAKISESYLHTGEIELFSFIKESIDLADNKGKQLPPAKGDYSLLNNFFKEIIIQQTR